MKNSNMFKELQDIQEHQREGRMPTPPADKSTTTGWMVVNVRGELYEASNAPTRRAAIMHHEGSGCSGLTWPIAVAQGDRLVRVEIKILRKTK